MQNSVADSQQDYKYLDESSFKDIYTSKDAPNRMNFYIEGVHCSGCLGVLESIPDMSEVIESVNLNMSTNIAEVVFNTSEGFSLFPQCVSKLGYKAYPVRNVEDTEGIKKEENKRSLYRIGVAGVCAGNIMLLSAAIYSGAQGVFKSNFEYLNLFLSLPVVTYCSIPFYKNVLSSLKARRTTVDIPVVFVVLVGFLLSAYNLLSGSEGVYFDSVTIFIFLLLSSRHVIKSLQQKMVSDTDLFNTFIKDNRVLRKDESTGEFIVFPLSEIKPGDVVRLNAGQTVPADGILQNSSSVFNLSVLTGESIPKALFNGSEVFAGSVLDSETADIRITGTGKDTRLGKILDNVKQNYEQKISFEGFSDKYASLFTGFVAVAAIFGFFSIANFYGVSEAFRRIVSFVLIACPCAFVFILPLTYGISLKSAVKKGFIIKDSNIFEKIKTMKNFIFDKTGTLTKGNFAIIQWDMRGMSTDDVSAVLAIEKMSDHPIARAIVNSLKDHVYNLPKVDDVSVVPSKGIAGVVNGHKYELYADKNSLEVNDSIHAVTNSVAIFKDGQKVSSIFMGDDLKKDAECTLSRLKDLGYKIYILSGDTPYNVKAIARMLSISEDNSFSSLTPEQKTDFITKNRGSVFIGDGLNDAGALSSADIGIAVQGSAEQSLEVSDIYLAKSDLNSVLKIVEHGNITNRAIKRNTILSIIYNVTAGTFALMGFINPLIAAFLMPLSSVVLLISSLAAMTRINPGGEQTS